MFIGQTAARVGTRVAGPALREATPKRSFSNFIGFAIEEMSSKPLKYFTASVIGATVADSLLEKHFPQKQEEEKRA